MRLLAIDGRSHARDLGLQHFYIILQVGNAERIERQWLDPAFFGAGQIVWVHNNSIFASKERIATLDPWGGRGPYAPQS